MTTGVSLKNTVFISNSLPKSGSTLLFVLQRAALNLAAGTTEFNYDTLKERGIEAGGGFVRDPNSDEFIKFIQDDLTDGPVVIKTHAPIGAKLRALYEEKANLFISLSIRDPLDIVLSAQDNFTRTGEFEAFQNLSDGCDVVNNAYRSIYVSTLTASRNRPIPIVRYTDLLADKAAAVAASFAPELLTLASKEIIDQVVSIQDIEKLAAHRKNVGAAVRDLSSIDSNTLDEIKIKLRAFRHELGYDS